MSLFIDHCVIKSLMKADEWSEQIKNSEGIRVNSLKSKWLNDDNDSMTGTKNIQVPISAVSTSSHSEQRSQARQSRWYCGKTWESRSVPNLKSSPCWKQSRAFLCSKLSPKCSYLHPWTLVNTALYLVISLLCFIATNKTLSLLLSASPFIFVYKV